MTFLHPFMAPPYSGYRGFPTGSNLLPPSAPPPPAFFGGGGGSGGGGPMPRFISDGPRFPSGGFYDELNPNNSPLLRTMRAWNRRAESALRAGLPLEDLVPVAKADLEGVQRGKAPLSNIEAVLATRGQITGKPLIRTPSGDEDESGGLLDFITNIPEDIANVARNLNPTTFVPALFEEAAATVERPMRTVGGLGKLATGDFTGAARVPGVRMIPGVLTASRLQSDDDEILKHPVETILDILPLTYAGAKGVARATVPADEATRIGNKAFNIRQMQRQHPDLPANETLFGPGGMRLTRHEGIVDALQRGRAFQAAYRTLPESFRGSIYRGRRAFTERLGVAPWQRELARGQQISQRGVNAVRTEMMADELGRLTEGWTPEEQATFYDVATTQGSFRHPEVEGRFTPEQIERYEPVLEQVRNMNQLFADLMPELVPVSVLDQQFYYPESHPVIKSQAESAKQEARLGAAEERVRGAKAKAEATATERAAAELGQLDHNLSRWRAERAHWERRPQPVAGRMTEGGRYQAMQLDDNLMHVTVNPFARNAETTMRNLLDEADRTGTDIHVYALEGSEQFYRNQGFEPHPENPQSMTRMHELRFSKRHAQLQERIAKAEARKAELREAIDNDTLWQTDTQYQRAVATQKKQLAKVHSTNQQLLNYFYKKPPANVEPMIQARIREAMEATARRQQGEMAIAGSMGGHVTPEQIKAIDAAVEMYKTTLDPMDLLGRAEYNKLKAGIVQSWGELLGRGYRPVWAHNVPLKGLARELNTNIRGLTINNPRMLYERTMDPTARVSNLAVSVSAAAMQILREQWHTFYWDNYVRPLTKTYEQIKKELLPLVDAEVARLGGDVALSGKGLSRDNIFTKLLDDKYSQFSPETFFNLGPAKQRMFRNQELYLPKEAAKTIEALMDPKTPGAIGRAAERITSIFKISVLGLSPKHMFDVLFSDTILMALRGGKEEFFSFREAARMVKEGKMPIELPRHMDLFTADQLFQIAAGKSLGRLLKDHNGVRKVAEFIYKIEERINNIQRGMSYLGEKKRQMREPGMTELQAHQNALRHAQETILDIDSLSALERSVVRQVFPFYSFMRYILKYVLTYPLDHPVRASILARVARIEQDDWNSGLPTYLQSYFFLGDPDKMGNVTAIDVRQMNPFRDLGSMFTFAGFLSQLHPVMGSAMEIAGLDPLRGVPELYPTMKYDPTVGRMVNARNPFEQNLIVGLSNVVPQIELFDYFGLMTQRMRELKAANPEAYHRVLTRNLFLPFGINPAEGTIGRKIDVGEEMGKTEAARLEYASRAVSDALRTGQPVREGFNYVPFRGELIPREQFNSILDMLKQLAPEGVSPKAVLGYRTR